MNIMPCYGPISSFYAEASPRNPKSSWTNCIARRVYASEPCARKPASWERHWLPRYPQRGPEQGGPRRLDLAHARRLRGNLAADVARELASNGNRAAD